MQLDMNTMDDDEIRYEFFDSMRQEKDPRFSPRHEMKTAIKWAKEYHGFDPGMEGNPEIEYNPHREHLKYENVAKQPVDPYLEEARFSSMTASRRSILGRAGFQSGSSRSLTRSTSRGASGVPSRTVARRKKKKPLKPKSPFDMPNTHVNALFKQSLQLTGKANLLGLKDDENKEGEEEEEDDEEEEEQVVIKLGSYDRISCISHPATGVELMVPPLAINQYHAGKISCTVPTYLGMRALPKLPIGKRCVGPTVQITPLDFSEFFKPLHVFLPHSSAIDFVLDDEDVQVLVCNGSRGASWTAVDITEHMPVEEGNVWQSFLTDEERGYAAIDDDVDYDDDDYEEQRNRIPLVLGPCGSATAVERGVVAKLERCCYARVVQSVPLAEFVCVCVYASDLYKPKTGRTVSLSMWIYADRPDQRVKQHQLEAESRQGSKYWTGFREVATMRGMVLNYGQRTKVFIRGDEDAHCYSEEFEWRGEPVRVQPEVKTPMVDELTDRMFLSAKLARCETTIEFTPLLDKEEKSVAAPISGSKNKSMLPVNRGIGRGGGKRGAQGIPKVLERSSKQEAHYALKMALDIEVPTYIT
jgi:hypothetical protein